MEEKDSRLDIIIDFIKHNVLFVTLIVAGLILVFVGVVNYLNSKNKSADIQFISSSESVKGTSDLVAKISVDIEGQVKKPGVYALPEGTRIKDAISSAGGLSNDADHEYVSKRLNQAQKLIDGAKIYIPAVGEITKESSNNGLGAQPLTGVETLESTSQDTVSGLININSASMDSLDTLPRIGPVTAQKIVNGRPYGTIEELVGKKILTQKTFEGLRVKIIAQ